MVTTPWGLIDIERRGAPNAGSWDSPPATRPGVRATETWTARLFGWSRAVTTQLLAAVTLGSSCLHHVLVAREIRLADYTKSHVRVDTAAPRVEYP